MPRTLELQLWAPMAPHEARCLRSSVPNPPSLRFCRFQGLGQDVSPCGPARTAASFLRNSGPRPMSSKGLLGAVVGLNMCRGAAIRAPALE
eukprot:4595762-Alexandrium_andersonii.AAC.1